MCDAQNDVPDRALGPHLHVGGEDDGGEQQRLHD